VTYIQRIYFKNKLLLATNESGDVLIVYKDSKHALAEYNSGK